MFKEITTRWCFLSKKVLGKKLSVSIRWEVSQSSLLDLSNKEFSLYQNTPAFISFWEQLYDTVLLENVTQRAIFLENTHNDQTYANFAEVFIYESNKTEGSKIPFDQLQLIWRAQKSAYGYKNEVREVQNSRRAWEYLSREFVFNIGSIKRLYHILTESLLQENGDLYPRGFKKYPIIVNDETATAPDKVPLEMMALLQTHRELKKDTFVLQRAFDFHLRFEKIHPFENGNGRVGRLIMNKILIAGNFPPMIIFATNRQAYFNAIASTRDGRKKKYFQFMLEQYAKSLELFEHSSWGVDTLVQVS